MPSWKISRTTDQKVEAVVELLLKGCQRQVPEANSRELERERESVEAAADLRDGGGCLLVEHQIAFDGVGALEEQGRGRVCAEVQAPCAAVGDRERRQSQLVFAENPKGRSAGDEEGYARAGNRKLGNECSRGKKVLERVKDHKRFAIAEVVSKRLGCRLSDCRQPQLTRDQRRHKTGIARNRKRHEDRTVGEIDLGLIRRLDREASLPNTARPNDRQDPNFRVSEAHQDRGEVIVPPDQCRQRRRQARPDLDDLVRVPGCPSGPPGRAGSSSHLERRSVASFEMQCVCQAPGSVPVDPVPEPALDVADRPGAYRRALGQFFLREAGFGTVPPQQITELLARITRHLYRHPFRTR
jgi:hypothetical protein